MDYIRTGGVLLPDKSIDLYKWAVVACDQFTADPGYWETLRRLVGDAPSTLDLIYPECFLKTLDSERIAAINRAMRTYLDDGLFRETDCVRTERQTVYGRRRTGYIFKIDLDAYDYAPGNRAPIRATEGTVPERIPPRVAIRYDAPLELPHVMLLYSDPDNAVSDVPAGERLYDTELNMRGGRVTGYAVDGDRLTAAFGRLAVPDDGMCFLVGDGNHSLAAAKQWYLQRTAAGLPASRYALVEAVNIFDPGIVFEPIHRLVITDDPAGCAAYLKEHLHGDAHTKVYCGEAADVLNVPSGSIEAVKAVQKTLDDFVRTYGGEIDYIHGENDLKKAARSGAGIVLPAMGKDELFPYVRAFGVLPRKTFSMGEAEEKRYYLEGARIA